MAHGEIIHAVRTLARVERVRHQHGVIERRHVDAVLGEHVEVVLDVLADLEDRRILEQRLQQRQCFHDRHLHDAVVGAKVEAAGAGAMGERHVARFSRRDGHGETDQLGHHGIDRGRFGVEGEPAGRIGLGDPHLQLLARCHCLVFRTIERGLGERGDLRRSSGGRFGRNRGARASGRGCGLLGRHGRANRNRDGRRRLGAERFGNTPRQCAEFHLLQEGEQHRRNGVAHAQRVGGDHLRHIILETHKLARDARLVGELDELLAPLGLLDLAGAGQQRVEIAVFVDQLGRRLDADARHTRHVVGRIPGQRLHVDNLVGRHAELLDHLVAADLLGLHGVEHDNAGAHELHQVLVGGDDGDVAAGIDDLARIAGDEIVGLKAQLLDAGDIERLHRVADERKLRDEFLGRGRAMRLVVLVDLVAECLLRGIEDDREMGRRFRCLGLAQQLPQHGTEAMHGTDRQPVRGTRQGRQRVEGAEDVARSVDEVDVASLDDGCRLAVGNRRRRRPSGFGRRFAHVWVCPRGYGGGL